jgi:hypothetical protein
MEARHSERREESAFSPKSAEILHGVYPERSFRQPVRLKRKADAPLAQKDSE